MFGASARLAAMAAVASATATAAAVMADCLSGCCAAGAQYRQVYAANPLGLVNSRTRYSLHMYMSCICPSVRAVIREKLAL